MFAACFLFLALRSVLGATASGRVPDGVANAPYKYRSYSEVMGYFQKLATDYPDIVETFIAQDEWPEINPAKASTGMCQGKPCQTLVVRIGRKPLLDTTPELFFSGALHGDEQLGPLVVTELAGFLCSRYKAGDDEIRRLVDGRSIWITPMTNPEGFANNHREEMGMDPNRDFPYLQNNCMRTQTARVSNELFRRHLIQYMITFHGGMRALTYEWGSKNHMRGRKSTESPDNQAFVDVGKSIQQASGKTSAGKPWYPLAPITDAVYYVDGGMEDWSYGAGWEDSPSPITVCKPKTYGGYSESKTKYKKGSIATLVYLAEADDRKKPLTSQLGRTVDLYSMTLSQGQVARNMRMCLKLIELTKPEVVVHPPSFNAGEVPSGTPISVDIHGFGCLTLNAARLLLVPRNQVSNCESLAGLSNGGSWDVAERQTMLDHAVEIARIQGETKCQGLSIWELPAVTASHLAGHVPATARGEFCIVVAAEFDQHWKDQKKPDPAIAPRSHAARSRIDEHYVASASEGRMRIEEFKTKLFPVLKEILQVTAAAASPAVAPAAVPAAPAAAAADATPAAAAAVPSAPVVAGIESKAMADFPAKDPADKSFEVASGQAFAGSTLPVDISNVSVAVSKADLPPGKKLAAGTPASHIGGVLVVVCLGSVVAVLAACNAVELLRLRREGFFEKVGGAGPGAKTEAELERLEEMEDL